MTLAGPNAELLKTFVCCWLGHKIRILLLQQKFIAIFVAHESEELMSS